MLVTDEGPYVPESLKDKKVVVEEEEYDYSEDEPHERRRRSIQDSIKIKDEPKMQITRLTYHMTNYFADNLYNSCK